MIQHQALIPQSGTKLQTLARDVWIIKMIVLYAVPYQVVLPETKNHISLRHNWTDFLNLVACMWICLYCAAVSSAAMCHTCSNCCSNRIEAQNIDPSGHK